MLKARVAWVKPWGTFWAGEEAPVSSRNPKGWACSLNKKRRRSPKDSASLPLERRVENKDGLTES